MKKDAGPNCYCELREILDLGVRISRGYFGRDVLSIFQLGQLRRFLPVMISSIDPEEFIKEQRQKYR